MTKKTILRSKNKKKKNFVDYNQNTNTKNTSNNNTNKSGNNNTKTTSNKTSSSSSSKKEPIFDTKYNIEANYFYQDLSEKDWKEINNYLNSILSSNNINENSLKQFFAKYPNLKKGNIQKLQDVLDFVAQGKNNFTGYQKIMNFFLREFYNPKPALCECVFFPNPENERKIVNMLRTCKKSLDIAIYTISRDNIAKAIIEAHKRGIKVRIISDDECVKNLGSDIYSLAAEGIPCKTDSEPKFHMHDKFAVIDNSVIVTGSFNWTSQAINSNQENLLFLENKEIAEQYSKEFDKVWNQFQTVITKDFALKEVEKQKTSQKTKK